MVRDRTDRVSDDVRRYASERLLALGHHLDLISRAEVEFDLDSKRSQEPLHVVKVNLDLLGADLPFLRSREVSRDLRTALDLAMESVGREVDELKRRVKAHP